MSGYRSGYINPAFKPNNKPRALLYRVVTVAGETLDPQGFSTARSALEFGHETGVGGLWWVEAIIGEPVDPVVIEKAILTLKEDAA